MGSIKFPHPVFTHHIKMSGTTPWKPDTTLSRGGVILIHDNENGKDSLLLIEHRHTQVWAKVIENTTSLREVDWDNLNLHELDILSSMTVDKFISLSREHCKKYDYNFQKSRAAAISSSRLKWWILATKSRAKRQISDRNRNNKTRWTFPKGCQLQIGDGLEDIRDTAIRELFEETGVKISRDELGENMITIDDRGFDIVLWLVKTKEAYLPNLEVSNDEVTRCQWIPLDDKIERLLSGRDRKILSAISPHICSESPYMNNKTCITIRGQNVEGSELRTSITNSLPIREPMSTSNSFSAIRP